LDLTRALLISSEELLLVVLMLALLVLETRGWWKLHVGEILGRLLELRLAESSNDGEDAPPLSLADGAAPCLGAFRS
jgi:hypothetical protein